MSSEAQIALIVGVIAAASGLIGVLGGTVLGWWLNGRTERRGEKRAAFVELLSAMDECQQACTMLSIGVSGGRADVELLGARSKLVDAYHRVETASNLAMLAVGREHEQVLRDGAIVCVEEGKNANHGTTTMRIVEMQRAIRELGRRELS